MAIARHANRTLRTERTRGTGSTPFLLREALWGLDWLSLRLSPVYRGAGVPKGDGAPVVLVPGFLTTDTYMMELYFWLRRVGYEPYMSGIGVNADCMEELTRRLERTVVEVYGKTGRPVRIIGHSLGGVLARRLALRRPEMVEQIISLGTPIKSLEAHPLLMATARLITQTVEHARYVRRDVRGGRELEVIDGCECRADHCSLAPPSSVSRAAIYSRRDGVVDWRNCLEEDPELNHEVGSTHIGLVFSPQVYAIIGRLLADPRLETRPRAGADRAA